jgi:group I intron endonuclease
MKSGVYIISNIFNDKKYIGSSNNIIRRKSEHFRELKNNNHKNKYLQSSYNKYGAEFFVFSILERCNIEKLIEREKYWISIFQSSLANKGYNLSIPLEKGGYEMSDITREKLRRITLKQKLGIETKKEYQKWKDKKLNYKNREKFIYQKKQKKKIFGFNKDTGELVKIFNSISEVGKNNNLYKIIDNPKKTYKGLTLVREENYDTTKTYKKQYKEKVQKELKGHFKGYPLKCINIQTKEEIVFNNKFEAINELGFTIGGINKVLYKERKSHKGYIFELLK